MANSMAIVTAAAENTFDTWLIRVVVELSVVKHLFDKTRKLVQKMTLKVRKTQ